NWAGIGLIRDDMLPEDVRAREEGKANRRGELLSAILWCLQGFTLFALTMIVPLAPFFAVIGMLNISIEIPPGIMAAWLFIFLHGMVNLTNDLTKHQLNRVG